MLVVGRVDVGEVGDRAAGGLDRLEAEGHAGTGRRPRQHVGHPEHEILGGPRGPLLEVGHLHAGGGVDAVGGLHERDEHHRLEVGRQRLRGDRLADGIDTAAIFGLEEPRLHAERVGKVAGGCREAVELLDQLPGGAFDGVSICGDVAAGQRVREGVVVVGNDAVAAALEGVAHPRCAAEKVEHRRPRRKPSDGVTNQVEQPSLGSEILDHRWVARVARGNTAGGVPSRGCRKQG